MKNGKLAALVLAGLVVGLPGRILAQNPEGAGDSSAVRTNAMTIGHPNLPAGYDMAAYLDCGTQHHSGEQAKERIAVTAGAPYTFPGIEGPLADARDRFIHGLLGERDVAELERLTRTLRNHAQGEAGRSPDGT